MRALYAGTAWFPIDNGLTGLWNTTKTRVYNKRQREEYSNRGSQKTLGKLLSVQCIYNRYADAMHMRTIRFTDLVEVVADDR